MHGFPPINRASPKSIEDSQDRSEGRGGQGRSAMEEAVTLTVILRFDDYHHAPCVCLRKKTFRGNCDLTWGDVA